MPAKLTPEQRQTIKQLAQTGVPRAEIAHNYSISRERVRQLETAPVEPAPTIWDMNRQEAFAQIAAVDGEALWRRNVSISRIAAIAGTSPRYVNLWRTTNGLTRPDRFELRDQMRRKRI